ncbi:hypothetical protein [Halovivax limisalsi]|uniref:hypothetical protein n=1 Tax=Halovivax limisalsi TaxID=1453760 RepID=UPI001FFD3187|nr:hypothetical protein [Halovivax limisalsi]
MPVPSRLVLAAVLVAALALTAGCVGILSDDEGSSQAQMEKVPDSAEMVMHVDASVVNDQDVRDLMAQSDPEGVDSMEEGLAAFENQTGLDPDGVDGATIFMPSMSTAPSVSGQGEMGILLDSSWDAETLVESIETEEDVTLERTEYQGESVLWAPADDTQTSSPTYVAEHEDGQLMIGTSAAVKSSLDVTYGDAAALSGPMLDAFEDAPEGHVRFAMTTEGEAFDQGMGIGGMAGQGSSSAFMEDMTAVAGTFYTDDGTAGFEAHVHFSNADTADNAEGAASLALEEAAANAPSQQQQLIEKLSISADGDTVVVTWESPIDELADLESI